jgi:hypothetical protein
MSALKNLWKLLRLILGFMPEPTPEQLAQKIPLMRQKNDCAVPAVAIACGVKYEEAYRALWHWDLPFWLESPIFSNPMNLIRAIKALGKHPDDSITWEDITGGKCEPDRVIILVKNPENLFTAIMQEHWVVLHKIEGDDALCYWGNKEKPKHVPLSELKEMFECGAWKCAIEVMP